MHACTCARMHACMYIDMQIGLCDWRELVFDNQFGHDDLRCEVPYAPGKVKTETDIGLFFCKLAFPKFDFEHTNRWARKRPSLSAIQRCAQNGVSEIVRSPQAL